MANTDPKKTGGAQAQAAEKIKAPKIQLSSNMEKLATGTTGFWRGDVGDEIFGRILGSSANETLKTVLVELLAPAVAHKGVKGVKGVDQEMFLAKKGDVLHVNTNYEILPVLENAPGGAEVYIECTGIDDIGKGQTLKRYNVQMDKEIQGLIPGVGAAVVPRPSVAELKAAAAQNKPAEIPQNTPPSVQS